MSIILIYKGLNINLFPYGFSQVVSKNKRCPCGIEARTCKSIQCKMLGKKIGIKVGSSICEHNIRRSRCKECGGSSICEHNRLRSRCKECGGSSICEHNRERNYCCICGHEKYIIHLRRSRRKQAFKNKSKISSAKEDLGTTLEEWYKYLEHTFENRYERKRTEQDKVHIDEIIPCSAWNLPDDNKYCWHYLNSQYLLAEDNQSKYNQYDEKDKLDMIERIKEISVE